MPAEKQRISLSPINDFSISSNEVALVLSEFLDWVNQQQATGGGKTTVRMTKNKIRHIKRVILVMKKRVPAMQRLFNDLLSSGVFDRGSEKNITFQK